MQRDRDGTVVEGDESSSSCEDEDMGMDTGQPAQGLQPQRAEPKGPIIDDDGFQLVQSKKPGKAR